MKIAGIDYLEHSPERGPKQDSKHDSKHGNSEPIIFLHGIGGGAASFNSQLAQFEDYHCIAWHMPGYGDSTTEVWPPTFESLSIALNNFITQLGYKKAHLVGQSIGGMLAIEHAVRYSDQVATLTLIGTTPSFGGRDESFKDTFLKARLATLDAGQTMQQVAASSAPKLVGPLADEHGIQEIESILSIVPETTWRGILECLVTFNRRDDLASISQPCCLIAGSHDQNAPAKTMQKMSEKLSDSEYHLIEGAGHMVNQEASAQTNTIVKHFIEQHSL